MIRKASAARRDTKGRRDSPLPAIMRRSPGKDAEIASIAKEMAVAGVERFAVAQPEKAWKLVVYLAGHIQLATGRS